MKNKKGITLISLVITIVILIILSSVAIYLSLGNNGIFTRAKQAKELTNKQEATDIINLKITTAQMNKYAEKQEMPTLQELADVLYEDNEIQYVALETKVSEKEKITVGNKTSIFTKLNDYPYEFEINSSLQLASINGIKIATTEQNSNNSVYSTTEQIVGTWINNKPIYRKVISLSENVGSYNNTRYFTKTLVEDVDDIIDVGGYVKLNNEKFSVKQTNIDWNFYGTFCACVSVRENNLNLNLTYNVSAINDNGPITGTVWVEYTKK